PVTDVRMVKRIVAMPGDTIAMNGGVMSINGTTATYIDLDPAKEKLPDETRWYTENALGKKEKVEEPLAYQTESLLGLTRTVQHIESRWLIDAQLIAVPSSVGVQHALVNDGWLIENNRRQNFEQFKQANPDFAYDVLAEIKDATIRIDGQSKSYNELATIVLESFTQGSRAAVLKQIGLSIDGHAFQIDGNPASYEHFRVALQSRSPRLIKQERVVADVLRSTLGTLHPLLMNSFGPVTLGKGEYYMVGDNRNNSHDSRYFGPVKRSEITGEAFAVAFSFKDNQMLAVPPRPAWSRFFKDLD
ncbi:MAG: S26 family signal peptidase, partial [Phycisphaeraceae bacterium]